MSTNFVLICSNLGIESNRIFNNNTEIMIALILIERQALQTNIRFEKIYKL